MEYNDYISKRIADLSTRQAAQDHISVEECFADLNWARAENKRYFSWLVSAKIVSRNDLTRAIESAKRDDHLKKEFGEVPKLPIDFARLYMSKLKVKVTYKGGIEIPGCTSSTILDLQRGARLMSDALKLPYHFSLVNDAIEQHYSRERDSALTATIDKIEPRAEFEWERLVRGCFNLRHTSAEFVIAVLKKFLWQTKRKLHGITFTYPLMPVIRGAQGKGKSHFVMQFLNVIDELWSGSNFEAIGDDRNIDLWRSAVIFLDEMGKAGKADMETTKNVITADYLERRPMRSNTTVRVRQCATFIGTTNPSLAEIIRDETGNRRFVELLFGDPEFGFMDQFDYLAAWRSVHHTDADPMADYMSELSDWQAESRNHGPVESWLRDVEEGAFASLRDGESNLVSTQDLYEVYLGHRREVNGGQEREHRTRNTFAHELARVTSNGEYQIEKHRTAKANGWRVADNPDGARRDAVRNKLATRLDFMRGGK